SITKRRLDFPSASPPRFACAAAALLAAATAGSVSAQTPATPPTAAAPAAAAAPAPPSWYSRIQLSGSIDTYYSLNPATPHSRLNQLQNWTFDANQFALPLAELQLQEPPDPANSPLGFKVVLGFGRALDWINSNEPGTGYKNLKEAYGTWIARGKSTKPVTINLGKFVTPAGAEVIESQSNFNYTHGLLFSWAIPYYHMGVSASVPLTSKLTGTAYLVNGWNDVVDNNNAKTVGLSMGYTPNTRWNSATNIFVGPEIGGDERDYRELLDEVLTVTPNSKWTFLLNYDYAHDRSGGLDANGIRPNVKWQGLAAYAHYVINPVSAWTVRGELFNDGNGAAIVPPTVIPGTVLLPAGGAPLTPLATTAGGARQEVKEVTFTYEYRFHPRIITRFEVREDWSTASVFDKGTPAIPGTGGSKQQTQLVIGNVFTF
ncbi:MAG: porin, partial [Chloroflexi bacterium]|nr:porin [Chloroflexota bacterium]